jgi:hypothetical protein
LLDRSRIGLVFARAEYSERALSHLEGVVAIISLELLDCDAR